MQVLMPMLLIWLFLTACGTVSGPSHSYPRERTYPDPVHTFSRKPAPVQELKPDAGLSDYLYLAALNNPGLESAYHQWLAALERIPQAEAYPDPVFSYAYFLQEVETRVGPQRQKFKLSQKLPWFGTPSLKSEMVANQARVEEARYEARKQTLFYEVKTAYYDLYFLGRSIEVVEENLQLLEHLEQTALTGYKVGIATNGDLIKIQVEIESLKNRLQSMRDLKIPIAARLNSAMNRPEDAVLPWPRELPPCPETMDAEQLLERLQVNNPELQAKAMLSASAEDAIELAKKDFYPDLSLGLEFIDTRHASMPGVRDSGKDPWVASLSVNLPLFNRKRNAAEQEAMLTHASRMRDREDRANRLIAELKMSLYAFNDATRRVRLYRSTLIPKAEQALKVAETGFTAGKADFLNLIDSQRGLLEFELSYEKARVDCAKSTARIDYLTGGKEQSLED